MDFSKFDHHFKACRSFCFELKVLNESKYSMPWVRCAFGNVLFQVLSCERWRLRHVVAAKVWPNCPPTLNLAKVAPQYRWSALDLRQWPR